MRKVLLAPLCLIACSTAVFGQAVAGLGAISGSVRDASGAGVPGAEVVIANTAKGIRRTLATNEVGLFVAPSLVPSAGYTVTVNKSGFSEFNAREIEVLVGQNVKIDVALAVAGTATQVNVEAVAPVIDATRTDVSQVVNSAQIVNLPINGRRVDSFVLLAPAVVPDGTFGLVSFRGTASGNAFLTDGNDTTNQFYNENAGRTRISSQISQDAVQEFQVLSNGYSAEFGRASGGVVNTVTRSGGNDLHGTAYWFFRNQDFNARDPFATINPTETRHQAGASLGGRLIKDKLFYFGNFEVTRRDFPLIASITSPPLFTSTGQFIPSNCGAPATPEQCAAATKFMERNFGVVPRTANSELGFLKLDWRPTERNAFSASMNYLRWLSPNGIQTQAVLNNGNGIGNNANSTVRNRYGRFTWTAIPTSSSVNEFRFGWFKDKLYDYPNPDFAIPGIGFLTLTVQGQSNLGTSDAYPRLNPSENRFQFADNFTKTQGRHTWKAGFDMSRTEDYNDIMRNRNGTYSYPSFTAFAQDFTGNATGAKRYTTYSQRFGNSVVDTNLWDFAFFVQDQYRLTPNLTLNYGMRYDVSKIPQPKVTNPEFPATGVINSAKKNFAPRVGFAYSFNNSRTVLRAGYGIFHARLQTGLLNTFFLENGVYQKAISLATNNSTDLALAPVFPNRLAGIDRNPPAGTVNVTMAARDFRTPYTQQGDVAIEHEITRNLGVTVNYIWSRGLHLTSVTDVNAGPFGDPVTYRINDASGAQVGSYTTPTYRRGLRPNANWAGINIVDAGANSYYNALAVQVRKRLSKGVEGSLAYTWSHALDYLGGGFGGGANNNIFFSSGPSSYYNGNYRNEKGSSLLDQRHRLTISAVWAPVLTKREDPFSRYLVNNWQLSLLGVFASAPPTQPTVRISGQPFPGTGAQAPLSNTGLNGFSGSSRVPFVPVNSLDVDTRATIDARLSKVVPIAERYKLYLNFEAFNVMNHTYYTGVLAQMYSLSNMVLTPDARYGQGSATQGFPDGTNARRAQVSARFVF